ncbi:SIMPL domain-containing protein [Sphaerochaeta globosa]|jgi:hypothetical protein|uniref:26 kDa periplasmic immunogenic protein n=1 Tax=Sphaerochaeta globosa (strain ATCC BAA-1886 / DSM 22777 / Buddy) TaxID=158189 RepID=F0RUN6_SPHGB|nr:SIMPL domain-containing protein [Sphaerochaeta globosa]ADY12398.1 protein of unknown function DUF541 [Sphaerochaeta globosa str. Buddy]
MKQKRIAVFGLLVAVVLLLTSCMSSKDLVRTIEVSATGEVMLTPDIASFSIQVSELGKTTSEAQAFANEKMAQLLSIMRENGVEEKDIKTTMLNLRPSYQWIEGKQFLEGQVASQSLSVTLRNLDKLGSMIDQLGEVSGIYLNSVMLDKEDKSIGLEQARQQAVQKALAKAELYAQGAQMQVGKPITISEYTAASNPYNTRMKVAMASESAYDMATEIPAGTMTVTSTVSMVLEMY